MSPAFIAAMWAAVMSGATDTVVLASGAEIHRVEITSALRREFSLYPDTEYVTLVQLGDGSVCCFQHPTDLYWEGVQETFADDDNDDE